MREFAAKADLGGGVGVGTGIGEMDGEPHLVVMGQDGCDLAAGEGDILARKLIDGPSAGIEGMVESKVPTQAPVPVT